MSFKKRKKKEIKKISFKTWAWRFSKKLKNHPTLGYKAINVSAGSFYPTSNGMCIYVLGFDF